MCSEDAPYPLFLSLVLILVLGTPGEMASTRNAARTVAWTSPKKRCAGKKGRETQAQGHQKSKKLRRKKWEWWGFCPSLLFVLFVTSKKTQRAPRYSPCPSMAGVGRRRSAHMEEVAMGGTSSVETEVEGPKSPAAFSSPPSSNEAPPSSFEAPPSSLVHTLDPKP